MDNLGASYHSGADSYRLERPTVPPTTIREWSEYESENEMENRKKDYGRRRAGVGDSAHQRAGLVSRHTQAERQRATGRAHTQGSQLRPLQSGQHHHRTEIWRAWTGPSDRAPFSRRMCLSRSRQANWSWSLPALPDV